MSAQRGVLALVRAQAAHHLSLSRADAFSAQEAPKWMEAVLAIAELIEAASAIDRLRYLDEASDAERERLSAALRRMDPQPGEGQ